MWAVTAWQCKSAELNVKGFETCCTATAVERKDGECCGRLGAGVTKKALNVKMETVTLIGEGTSR